jgi:hypothetical protein
MPPSKSKPHTQAPDANDSESRSTAKSVVSGPVPGVSTVSDAATAKAAGTDAVASAFPFNAAQLSEFGEGARDPAEGQAVNPLTRSWREAH